MKFTREYVIESLRSGSTAINGGEMKVFTGLFSEILRKAEHDDC